jgi:1,4-dihydroxy-2-naphthoyl-CoA hydrolase
MIRPDVTIASLNAYNTGTLSQHIGIEITDIGPDFLAGRMPVDSRTHQPFGILHGGASVAFAETLGSLAAFSCIDSSRFYCVGLDINANHVRSVSKGYVYGKATPLHIGKSTHVWEIKITNEEGKLVCINRITMAILERKQE